MKSSTESEKEEKKSGSYFVIKNGRSYQISKEDREAMGQSRQGDVNLYNQKQFHILQEVVPNIDQWNCKKLWLFSNKRSSILKQLYEVNFLELTWISLSGNKISSIEIIQRMNFPHLSGIYLTENPIVSISPLRKLRSPLKSLGVFETNIVNMAAMSELVLADSCEFMEIDFDHNNRVVQEDCRWIAKTECKSCERINLKSKHRIPQTSVRNVFLKTKKNFNQ